MTDVCIVGAGAGGLAAAAELSRAGHRVTVLDKGRSYAATEFRLASPTWETDPLPFEGPEYTSAPPQTLPDRPSLRSHRRGWPLLPAGTRAEAEIVAVRGVGGGTLRYQAVARRLPVPWAPTDEYEGMERALGVTRHALSYASRHVKQAFDRLRLSLEPAPAAILAKPEGGRRACTYCAGCTYGCTIGAKSSADLAFLPRARDIGLITGASAHRLERQGRVTAVLYHDREGREHRIEAEAFVLAAGALETPRLLQLSGFEAGRGVMESLHVSLTLLSEEPLGSYRGVPIDALCEDFERPQGFVIGVSQSAVGLLGPVSYAKRLAPVDREGHAAFMKKYFGNAIGLYASAGQASRAENRIALDSRKDRFGLPLPRIESRLDAADLNLLETLRERLLEIAAEVPNAKVVEQFSSYDLPPGGTELRGSSAGLVDETGRVKDVPNLYVADASLFPTAGSGNPSLTIMALATRVARRIGERHR